jgi:glycosyltransferase involved in cell wall biosynthesis
MLFLDDRITEVQNCLSFDQNLALIHTHQLSKDSLFSKVMSNFSAQRTVMLDSLTRSRIRKLDGLWRWFPFSIGVYSEPIANNFGSFDVSICILSRNSSGSLSACLGSLGNWMKEVIVIDSYSDDASVEIAREWGARIALFRWKDDFSAARNFSVSLAKTRWVLFIDTDEIVNASFGSWLGQTIGIAEKIGADSIILPRSWISSLVHKYDNVFEVRNWRGHFNLFPDLQLRCFRRDRGFYYEGHAHEVLIMPHDGITIMSGAGSTIYHLKLLLYSEKELKTCSEYYEKICSNNVHTIQFWPLKNGGFESDKFELICNAGLNFDFERA